MTREQTLALALWDIDKITDESGGVHTAEELNDALERIWEILYSENVRSAMTAILTAEVIEGPRT